MSLHEDWYVYHSNDNLHWFLQEGGPYTDDNSKEVVKEDKGKNSDTEFRVARIAYPQGALPDKRIERTSLDQTTPNKE